MSGTTLVDDSLPESEQSLSMPAPFARAPGEHDSETTLEMSAVHVHERTAVAPDQDGDTMSDADDPMPPPPEVVTPSGAALLADLERDLAHGADPAEVLDATAPAVPPEAIVPLRETADELTAIPLFSDLTEDQRATIRQMLDGMLREHAGGNHPAALSNKVNIGIGTK